MLAGEVVDKGERDGLRVERTNGPQLHEGFVTLTFALSRPQPPSEIGSWKGRTDFWEHLGILDETKCQRDWKVKRKVYQTDHPDRLIATEESPLLRAEAERHIPNRLS